jgi:DNA polymerase-3 subunit gamma/tau
MSELALYRKYRPQKFDEIVGQEHITDVLKGSIKEGTVSHAYLFSGGRGIGKTSVARIFARALGSDESDIYEMDAASNTGVDDVRALQEAVYTLPYKSKYKIYIIDEVHMMSKSAFNALLKTLEEPPSHVIFILATTDPEKLLETVVSRCIHFKFKKPTQKMMRDMAIQIAKKEGFSLETSSADLVALLGDGSFRDMQGILQKVISASKDKKISESEVLKVTGTPSVAIVNGVIGSIEEGNVEKGLKFVGEARDSNADMKAMTKLLLHKIRSAMLLRYAPSMEGEIKEEFSAEDFAFLKKMASSSNGRIGPKSLSRLIATYDESSRTHLPELPLEIALIELCSEQKK